MRGCANPTSRAARGRPWTPLKSRAARVAGLLLALWGLPPRAEADANEEPYYRLETIPIPEGISLEVGGLAFWPDEGRASTASSKAEGPVPGGTLLVATRRGDVWTVRKPEPASSRSSPAPHEGVGPPPLTAGGFQWRLFASGLHEPLGVWPGKVGEIFVVQRPELTRIRDTDGDGRADSFEAICAAWGISGNYHEFAFGPVRDAEGSFWGTLNLAHHEAEFGEMDSIAPFRGWTFKVTAKGEFTPWSVGLRSPNGIGIAPKGDIFYTDNQGGWVGTSFLAHVTRGAFHGHPAGLRWDTSFRGDPGKTPLNELDAKRKRPAVLFPHGAMGQSPSQPLWDTTAGKFGPFAGQVFVGDQTKSTVMRASLEKVAGEWQGACYPFRAGFQCGNNRLAFGADGSLWVGQTERGWGAVGGKPWGLERLAWTGRVPMEIHTMSLTKTGFDLVFTKPVDPGSVRAPAFSMQRYFYEYHKAYGSPQMDVAPVAVREARVSADRRRVSLTLPALTAERIYELHIQGLRAADGSELLHPVAYYTLNRKAP